MEFLLRSFRLSIFQTQILLTKFSELKVICSAHSSRVLRIVAIAIFGIATFLSVPNESQSQEAIDTLLNSAAHQLETGPEAAKGSLQALSKQESIMTPAQRGIYYKLLASSYAFRGMYKEQVDVSSKALQSAEDADLRAALLYYLADGYSNLGDYEKSLQAMNQGIQLLPKLSKIDAKMGVLQSAFSLLESMHAYEDAGSYAERLVSLPSNGSAECVGRSDLVELAFLQHDREHARAILPDALRVCELHQHKNIQLSVQALDMADRLDFERSGKYLAESINLLNDLVNASGHSDYSIQLADSIAKAYQKNGDALKAELYAAKAIDWANEGNAILLQQQANETMALVMRTEGRFEQAIRYLASSNELWAKMLEQRSRKDLAYQRMKFQSQDQSNQLQFLGQINDLLTKERELQDRNKRSLELLVFVTAILLIFLSVWLMRTWRQKNDFKTYSQIDGLTRISNRSHFIACAHDAFKDARGSISVILFDMDEFKLINDTHSHAAGDWVLKTVSSTITACLRSQDIFGRLGGEEFGICLPRTSEQEAMILAERCRHAIASIDSSPSGNQFSLSASFGTAVRPPGGSVGFEEVLAAADRALYQAKNLGRNRIAPFGEVHGHSSMVA